MKIKTIILISTAVITVLVGIIIFVIYERHSDENDVGVDVYFFDSVGGYLASEFRDLSHLNAREHVEATLRYFVSEPTNSKLTCVVPADAELVELITEILIENGVLTAITSDYYLNMPPIDEVLFRSAFTLTMVGLPYIDSVVFVLTDGEERFESAETIANNPLISPTRRTVEDFTLFFVDESGEGLVTRLFESVDVNLHRREQQILELLIGNQNVPGVLPLIPADTRVLDVRIELDAGGIYVDFSSEFYRGFSGNTAQARLMLQSVTHTMLENISGTPRRVFFFIDTERLEEFHGLSDFDLEFTIDETVMLGYTEEDAE